MWSLLAAAALVVAAAAAPPQPAAIKAGPIAKAVRYTGPLVVAQEGTGEISKAYGNPVWAASVTAADGSFLPLSILLLDGGSFLTAGVRERFDKAIAKPQEYAANIRADVTGRLERARDDVDRSQAQRELRELDRLRAGGPLVRAVRLPKDGRGYTVMLGFSRIDSTFATVLPSPDGRYELLVSVATPFPEPNKTPKPLTPYQKRMSERPLVSVESMGLVVYRQLFAPK